MGNSDKKQMMERILEHALKIICLLTGQDCVVVKKHSKPALHITALSVSETLCKSQNPIEEHPTDSLIHEANEDTMLMTKKIVEEASKIMHLLTGEVPIKCDDVAVYFSMEELEYLEGHKGVYKDAMMGSHQTFSTLDFEFMNISEEVLSPPHSPDCTRETEIHHGGSYRIVPNPPLTTDITDLNPTSSIECGQRLLKNSTSVKLHMAHEEEKQYACLVCGKSFAYSRNLFKCRGAHRGEMLYVCTECVSNFTQSLPLHLHLDSRTRKTPHVCAECKIIFPFKYLLVLHQRKHTGEKPYGCSECEKAFRSRSELVKHQRTHTGVRPYACGECGKKFTYCSNFIMHKRIHTGEKPYVCGECGKGFTCSAHLVLHKRTHTGEKPFQCNDCGKRYICNSNLGRHKKTHKREAFNMQ
ncbi:uncharacterized protein LOC142498859 [Ascaphus truei]|uniref:uncharacterized protein LOC142498859 n=1 Tax=Ascaphus truei TaxID=8439 RepID=UPI003F5AA112